MWLLTTILADVEQFPHHKRFWTALHRDATVKGSGSSSVKMWDTTLDMEYQSSEVLSESKGNMKSGRKSKTLLKSSLTPLEIRSVVFHKFLFLLLIYIYLYSCSYSYLS